MKDPRYRVYLLLGVVILSLFSLSTKSAQKVRSAVVASLAPLWQQLTPLKAPSENTTGSHGHQGSFLTSAEQDALQLENRRLLQEINTIKEMVRREMNLLEELKSSSSQPEVNEIAQIAKKRYWHRFNLLMQLKAVPANIIYRSPAFWDQCCWINVGTSTNDALGVVIVSKNSPVVVGDSIVGVIDEVGEHQSRLRFLTDGALTPSVRVLRKSETGEDLYLAKGELHGAAQSLWRSNGKVLKGVGFNYDFDDEAGTSRDLRTGRRTDDGPDVPELSLIQKGDSLVTTGMDGVFPPDFRIADVVHVYPLEEGDYTYEIDAMPSAGSFDEISQVFVLPSWGYVP